jgi:hypothetical protein
LGLLIKLFESLIIGLVRSIWSCFLYVVIESHQLICCF